MKIFLSYARSDRDCVEEIFDLLRTLGHEPWMDVKSIVPGEDWARAISRAIAASEVFVACLSTNSVDRRGWVQRELLKALDSLEQMLPQDIFIIPLRLELCQYPERLARFHGMDWFGPVGPQRLADAIQTAACRRQSS